LIVNFVLGLLSKVDENYLLLMLELVAYIAIGICLAAIAYSIKIYLESPNMKDEKKRNKKIKSIF
jgi:hypothetical protein